MTAPTTTRPAPPAATPITGQFYGRDMSDRPTLLSAVSVDLLWAYERVEDTGTSWMAGLIPTGQVIPLHFGTLREARIWTAQPGALATVRTATANLAEHGRTDTGRAEARTLLRQLDGLISGDLVTVEASHRCGECRGLLTETRDGWRHVAACRPGCWTPGGKLSPAHPCMTPEKHVYCDTPWPAPCAHGCRAPADATETCDRGDESHCCGCCRPDERGRP